LKKIGLVVKADPEARAKADELEAWLRNRQIQTVRKENTPDRRPVGDSQPAVPADLYAVFVLGGDGTFLSAARWIGDAAIPILGVKFGDVGFLAATAGEDLFSAAETILASPPATELRMRLVIRVFRGERELVNETALNDAVINAGTLARLAHIRTYIEDQYLTTYSADGLIISTPTGSTAYSLAAGGPVIHPAVPGIVMTPISPFTLTNRPLIVPDTASIRIVPEESSSDMVLTVDGQAGYEIKDRDTVLVEKSPHPLRMIILPDFQYYDVLKAKLRWSGGRS
jgi:NAD+ kinase